MTKIAFKSVADQILNSYNLSFRTPNSSVPTLGNTLECLFYHQPQKRNQYQCADNCEASIRVQIVHILREWVAAIVVANSADNRVKLILRRLAVTLHVVARIPTPANYCIKIHSDLEVVDTRIDCQANVNCAKYDRNQNSCPGPAT